MGRPVKYKTVDEMQTVIDGYFNECNKKDIPYTVTGLALELGMTRRGLIDYSEKDELFAHAVKMAKQKCESYAERYLYSNRNPAGAIFSLKNNWGWKDKQDIEVTTGDTATSIQAARERAKMIDATEPPKQIEK